MSRAVLAGDPDAGLRGALAQRECGVHLLGARRRQVLLDQSLRHRLAELLVAERADVRFDRASRQSSHVIACSTSDAAAHHRRCGRTPLTVATNPGPTLRSVHPECIAMERTTSALAHRCRTLGE